MSTLIKPLYAKGGKLARPGTVHTFGQKLTKKQVISVFTAVSQTAPLPYPTYTDYPVIDFATLDSGYYQRNLNKWSELPDMSVVLNSLNTRAYVSLPEGFRGKLVDFASGGTKYSCYAPKCMGLWGKGPDKAVIRMQPMSSTIASQVPAQSGSGTTSSGNSVDGTTNQFTLMRLGPMNSSTNAAVHNYGFALCGTDQPAGYNGEPHNYNGLIAYMGSGSTDEYLYICGVPGDWNSPPGETMQYAMYRTKTQCFARFVEVDGYNEPANIANAPTDFLGTGGRQVGGGVGNNGCNNPTYEDCYFHDGYVSSGPIFSGAGGPNGEPCHSFTVKRQRTYRNANHGPHAGQASGGKTFGGLNIEGSDGSCYVENFDIKMDNNATYQTPHVSVGNMLSDISDFVIKEPIWDRTPGNYPKATNGAFTINLPDNYPYANTPNAQKTIPTVIKNGIKLSPVDRPHGQGWPSGVNPDTQMIIIR